MKKNESNKKESKPPQIEDTQTLTIKYSFFKEQAEVAVKELQRLDMVKNDFLAAKETLEGITKARKGDKVLLPIGGNSYVNMTIDEPNDVLVGVGAGTVLNKSTGDALKAVNEELDDLEKRAKELIQNIKFSENELAKVAPLLQKMQQQQPQK